MNQVSKCDTYHIPRIKALFAQISGGQKFTTLDLDRAYQQLVLDEESRKYVVINTQLGLFQCNRPPFGVSSAPGIFQRTTETLLQAIPGVVVYLDDILITGRNEQEHLSNLDKVLTKLEEAGLRLNKDKCWFMQAEVVYLGHVIDRTGLHPDKGRIQAITEAPRPQNVTELKAYLGLLSYYGKFLQNLSTVLAPLHRLLRKGVKWNWSCEQERAFHQSKQLLVSAKVLAHFDPQQESVVTCDASSYGLGAVLAQRGKDGKEHPVAFASRTLMKTERNYAQVEREALAVIFGLQRFRQYLFGRDFVLVSDHKPLVGLLGENTPLPPMASARIHRWAMILSGYSYKLQYKPGRDKGNADACSRLPLQLPSTTEEEQPETIQFLQQLESSPVLARDVRRWTEQDPILSRVQYYVHHGWPNKPLIEV